MAARQLVDVGEIGTFYYSHEEDGIIAEVIRVTAQGVRVVEGHFDYATLKWVRHNQEHVFTWANLASAEFTED